MGDTDRGENDGGRDGSGAALTAAHLERAAYVYIRQSSDVQVKTNVERQRLQYALSDHAKELGFQDIEVIDADLGISGAGVHRPGFDPLLEAVCKGRAGLVLSIEASRLSRNGRDWHTLLDFCAIVGCLVGDRDRIYDPALIDDRMYLGLKGQFNEMELALFRQRSLESRMAMAQRGELFATLPAGYEKVERNRIEMTALSPEQDLGLAHCAEDLAVEQLVPKPGVETLSVANLPRGTRCDAGGLGPYRRGSRSGRARPRIPGRYPIG